MDGGGGGEQWGFFLVVVISDNKGMGRTTWADKTRVVDGRMSS